MFLTLQIVDIGCRFEWLWTITSARHCLKVVSFCYKVIPGCHEAFEIVGKKKEAQSPDKQKLDAQRKQCTCSHDTADPFKNMKACWCTKREGHWNVFSFMVVKDANKTTSLHQVPLLVLGASSRTLANCLVCKFALWRGRMLQTKRSDLSVALETQFLVSAERRKWILFMVTMASCWGVVTMSKLICLLIHQHEITFRGETDNERIPSEGNLTIWGNLQRESWSKDETHRGKLIRGSIQGEMW